MIAVPLNGPVLSQQLELVKLRGTLATINSTLRGNGQPRQVMGMTIEKTGEQNIGGDADESNWDETYDVILVVIASAKR